MKPSRDNRRKKVYIEGSFQRRFVIQFCGIVLAGCVVFGALLYVYSAHTLTTAFVHSRLHVMSTADFLLPALGFTALMVTVLVAVVAAARVMVLSHKIAGPLYRLERAAEAVGQGDLSQRIHLRDGDELQAFAQSLDFAVAELRWQLEQVRHEADLVGKILQEMKESPGAPPKLLEALQRAHAQMDRALGRFKV